ncbi:MAG: agmatinase [Bradymonadaceae bacterium]|nr:agmatinase [Lujinxingiaceae bacterium]
MSLLHQPYGSFIGSAQSAEGVRNVLFGIPMDFTCCFRAGTRLGPKEIRYFSDNLETYSVEQGRELREDSFFDAGDVELPFGNAAGSLEAIDAAVEAILASGKRPIALGGEHLVTAGIIRAIGRHYPDVVILHIDAHFDLRETYAGQALSHATALRQCWNTLGFSTSDSPSRLVQLGIRSGPREEAIFAREHILQLQVEGALDVRRQLESVRQMWGDRPVYCTFDIDALDPAFAPGTGTPEAGGLSSREALEIMRFLPRFNLVGFDLVEVSPVLDHAGITSALAAKMIRELLIALDAASEEVCL